MTLEPGSRLGPYEILSLIGAGGMGEVYKAKDTRLDRTVAIKVLPSHLAESPERRERFERESRAVSSLNHPHICTLHDIGEQDGTHYLVMEHIEGETLAARLKKGPLPLDQALQYAIQIADALDKAHRQGVVHRDLKPGNMMLTKPGIKLLDFGLAKLKASEPGQVGSELSALPTEQKPLTKEGSIIGTFQYMAPEQLEGKEADARTDIFAFGSVLYEMVTGNKAFEGKSQASLIGAILKDEPKPASEIQSMSPPMLDRVVKKCLAKDPENRWHTAHDLHDELKWIADGGSEAAALSAAPSRFWKRTLTAGLVFLMGAVVAGIAVQGLMHPGPQAVKRFAITDPAADYLWDLALSSDGRDLVYSVIRDEVRQLYRRPMDQLDASPISGTERGSAPFFSPDGEWLAFFDDRKLKKVLLAGGSPVTLCDAGYGLGGSWGPDDSITFASGEYSGLMQVQAAGGELRQITIPDADQGELNHRWPDILPGGKAVLFTVWYGSLAEAQIAVHSLETGEGKLLVEGSYPRFAPTGHIVFAREDSLWAVPFDADRLEVTGSPTPLLEGVSGYSRGEAYFSLASDGSLVFNPGIATSDTLVWVDRKGVVEPLPAPAHFYKNPRLSQDGERISVVIGDSGNWDIWIYDIPRGTSSRLTFTGENDLPSWAPDGRRVAFTSRRNGVQNIFWKAADGSSEEEQLTTGESDQRHASISSDGKFLAFHEDHPRTIRDIWVLPLTGEREARPLLQTQFWEGAPTFSPDGKWLAYVSNESGRPEIYVRAYPDESGKWQISNEGGVGPIWARNGRELFYMNGDKMVAVEITTEQGFKAGNPKLLFEGRYTLAGFPANYDVSPDGQRFLMLQPNEHAPARLNVVLNWFEELTRLAPADN